LEIHGGSHIQTVQSHQVLCISYKIAEHPQQESCGTPTSDDIELNDGWLAQIIDN